MTNVTEDELTITHNGNVYTLTDQLVTVSAIDKQRERISLTLSIASLINAAQAEAEHRQRCEKELSEDNWEIEQLTSYDVTVEHSETFTHGLTVKASSEEEAREIAEKYMDKNATDEANFTHTGKGVYSCEEIEASDSGYEAVDCYETDTESEGN